MQQRQAQPLFMKNLASNLTDFNSLTVAGKAKPKR